MALAPLCGQLPGLALGPHPLDLTKLLKRMRLDVVFKLLPAPRIPRDVVPILSGPEM